MTGALLAASVFAASSADAAPSVFSVEDNVVYAISTSCAPYALDLVERDGLPIGKGLVQPDGHDGLARPNPTGVRVGMAGFVHVTFVQSQDGSRSCDVQAKGADAQAVRRAALKALEGRPEQFAPMKSIYLPGRFASEDRLCASPTGPNPSAFIILSSTSPEQQGRIALLFTLHNGGARLSACDREGVPMNFRTLAPPQ